MTITAQCIHKIQATGRLSWNFVELCNFGVFHQKWTTFCHIGSFLFMSKCNFWLCFKIVENTMRPSWNDRILQRFFKYACDHSVSSRNRFHTVLQVLWEVQFTEPFAASQIMPCMLQPSCNFLKFWCAVLVQLSWTMNLNCSIHARHEAVFKLDLTDTHPSLT